jgi:hypothetical protein
MTFLISDQFASIITHDSGISETYKVWPYQLSLHIDGVSGISNFSMNLA